MTYLFDRLPTLTLLHSADTYTRVRYDTPHHPYVTSTCPRLLATRLPPSLEIATICDSAHLDSLMTSLFRESLLLPVSGTGSAYAPTSGKAARMRTPIATAISTCMYNTAWKGLRRGAPVIAYLSDGRSALRRRHQVAALL